MSVEKTQKVKGAFSIKAVIALAVVAVLASAPFYTSEYYLSIIRTILLWLGLSISWYFFSGLTKYVSLGSAAFFGLGVYFTVKYLDLSHKGLWPTLPLPVIILMGTVMCFALALVIGLVTLRVKGIYFAILTFGISEMLKNFFEWWEIRVVGTRGTYLPIFMDYVSFYYMVFVPAMIALGVVAFLSRSKFGLGLRMIGENEDTAVHVGVNTTILKTLGFAVSSMLIGLMGGCFAMRFAYVNVDIAFDPLYTFMPAAMTLLGGAINMYGPIIGAVILSLISEYLRVSYPHYFLIILGLVFIAIILFMPNGIMGRLREFKVRQQKNQS
ncbi:MAG: branched-chain amino acid ABC transporter permease [Candidatus Nezhaarchaeales archaeon]